MRIDILTLFPEMFAPIKMSILERAERKGVLKINLVNIRDFAHDVHQKCDDAPFGGGSGMIMMCAPLCEAIDSVLDDEAVVVYMSPRGKVLKQALAREYAKFEHIIIICGHYEGVDQRVLQKYNVTEISIGDYVLTGGELPAMVFTDCISRLVDGVISADSIVDESFSSNLLEYDQYTRPAEFEGMRVPDVLLSGNHAEIAKWRAQNSLDNTKRNRPDLLD
ncbi:MAG: tRNA (guanosine(37)-N1)-methyltransferase TrmD [Clostridia bacterium]|nr:tRNA (guanosine(37)-N1)-methyltransferase TrmD [Clostridia bacterium]